jgi:hypothetical protein
MLCLAISGVASEKDVVMVCSEPASIDEALSPLVWEVVVNIEFLLLGPNSFIAFFKS